MLSPDFRSLLRAEVRQAIAEQAYLLHPTADPVLDANEGGNYTNQHGKNLKQAFLRGEIPAVRRSDNGKLGFLLSDLNEYNRRYRRSLQVDAEVAADERDWAL